MNKNKIVKYGLASIVFVFILINSIDIKNLDEVKAAEASKNFDAASYAQNFWKHQRMASLKDASNIDQLLSQLEQNFDSTASRGEQVGISKDRYFLVRGTGTVEKILEDNVVVDLDKNRTITLATGFIFGNTVRNAVSQIAIGDFVNMTQFNQVSIQINKLVQKKIVPPLKKQAKVGRTVSFGGALSINLETSQLDSLRVIPLQIDIREDK